MFKYAWCCVAVFAALIGRAQAGPDDFDRVVSFGDSLSDNGNLQAAIGLPGPDYFFGRASNGPTFVELLAGPVNLLTGESSQQRFWGPGFAPNPAALTGDVNLAIAGAEAEGGLLPSVQTQIGTYLLFGGQFGPSDLVTMLAGANDVLNAGLSAAAAENAAIAQSINVGAVAAQGAGTILVANLPNLGATPQFNGSPQYSGNAVTAQLGLIATNTFNARLDQDIEQVAAANPQTNVVQMDLQAALDVVIANPAAFGFTDVTNSCYLGNGFVGTTCTNPDQFLFWDGVHPTAAGHELLGQYAAALLSTDEHGRAVAALGQVAVSTRLDASEILFRQGVPLLEPGAFGGLYAEVLGLSGSGAGEGGADDYDYQFAGIRAGFDARQDGVTFGGALAHLTGDVSSDRLNADTTTTEADIYALYSLSPVFVGAEAGVSFTDFDDVRRDTTFPTVIGKSDTDSVGYSIAGTIGTHLRTGGITLTPALRVGYLAADVDAFSESAPLLALAYSDRNIEAGFWTARLRASVQPFNDPRSMAYVEAGYEDLFSVDDGYSAKLVDNTAQAVQIDPDDPDGRGLFLKAGVSAYVTETAQLSAEYGLSLQDGGGDVHSARLTLKIPLGGPD
jgi:outer membrane lipase/esterase